MDTRKQLWDYVNQDRDNRFLKLNEEGKKAYLQYGYSKGLIKDSDLTEVSRSYISGIKSPTDSRKMQNEQRLEGLVSQTRPTAKVSALDRSQERYINPELGRSDAVLSGLLGGLTLGAVGKGDSDFEKLQQEHPIAQGAGYIAGIAAPFSGLTKATAPFTNLITSKVKSEVGKRALSGIIPGAIVDTATGAIAGERGTDLVKRVGEGAALGAVGDVALYGLGKIGKVVADRLKIGKLEKIPIEEITAQADIKPGTKILSQGAYKVKNTNLDKAYAAYNEAIETIQNHFQTNELRTDEMARIKSDLGIDLDKLVADIEQAEKGISVKAIGEQRNLANAAGVKPSAQISEKPLMVKTKYDTPEIVKARNEAKSMKSTHLINTPERQALRESVANKLNEIGSFNGADANGKEVFNGVVNKGKRVDIVIGPPAAGKSTVFANPLSQKYGARIIDSDMAKEMLPEFNGGKGAGVVHEESSKIAVDAFKNAIRNGDNIVLPLVGKNPDRIRKYRDILNDWGYEVHLHLNELPPDKAAQRAISRFYAENRFVDPDYIINDVRLKPNSTYDKMKLEGGFKSYERYSNDVEYKQPPKFIEKIDNPNYETERRYRGRDIPSGLDGITGGTETTKIASEAGKTPAFSIAKTDKRKLLNIDFDTINDTIEINNTVKSLQEYKAEIQAKLQTAKPEEVMKYRDELLKIDLQLFSAQKKLEPLKIRQANTAAEKPFGKAPDVKPGEKVHGNADILKEIDNDLEGAPVKSNPEITAITPTLKDTKYGFSYQLTDVYRNFKHAFGKNYEQIKKSILDPFDKSKKAYVDTQKTYTDELYNTVVKKLGIGKSTKLSEAVQWYGEGKRQVGVNKIKDPNTGKTIKTAKLVDYTLADLKRDFPDKWQDIVEADKWFRNAYDKLIDQVNNSRRQIYPNNPDKLVGKRTDYYRHFRELADTFEGVKNLFDTPANIDPKLVGVSEYTQPKSKWASFMQQRGMGRYKADAVGGFLDYIKAASYAINIDPQINVFRGLAKDIAEATGDSKNANNFIMFLRQFSNDLAGKTTPLDRWVQDTFNRKIFNVVNWANGRIKKNTVLYNFRSALSQFANVPQGIAKIKNPVTLTKGFGDMAAGLIGQGKAPELYNQSQFLSERYSGKLYSRFNTKMLEQPEKFASWLLEGTDEIGTKFIWSSAYNDALTKKIADPVKYADDLTRSLVAGRGIGEVPILQKSKVFQIIAPFQLEVTNLWHVMRDMVNEKDFGGIATLFLANYLLNEGMEKLTGSGVTFDPIGAIQDALKEDVTPEQVAGRLGGEVLSNMPVGQTIAARIPEDIRNKYMGRNDPTRFGGGLLVEKGLQDPLFKLLAPGGGAQIKKTYEGAKALTEDVPGVYGDTESGKSLKYLVDKKDIGNLLKGLIFGKSAFNEAQEYYGTNARPLSADQTKLLLRLAEKGRDPKKTYDSIMLKRKINALNTLIRNSKKDGTTDEEKAKIDQMVLTIQRLAEGKE